MDSLTKGEKRQLSSSSVDEEEAKKIKNSSTSSFINELEDEPLLSTTVISTLLLSVKGIEGDIKKLFELGKETRASQESSTENVNLLTNLVKDLSLKIDDLNEKLKEKDNEIKTLEKKITTLEVQIDDQEQYSRRNCLLLHGVPENITEDTDQLALTNIKENLGIQLEPQDLDRSHRLGRKNRNNTRPRPIIIKFCRYNTRNKVFREKKRLKGKNLLITESLTERRMKILSAAKDIHGRNNVWTSDGRIVYKDRDGKVKQFE